MEAELVERAAADGGKPDGRLDAGDVGGQQVGARCAAHVGGRQHRRPHAGGGVDDAARVGVVEVEAVHQDAVDERRVARRQARGQADHGHVALAAEAGDAVMALWAKS